MADPTNASPQTAAPRRWRRLIEKMLSIGAYPEETEAQRSRRRIMMAANWIATILSIPTIGSDIAGGYMWSAVGDTSILVVTAAVFVTLHLRPRWFAALISILLGWVFVWQLVQTAMFGGLYGSSLSVVFGMVIVLAVLLVFGLRTATWWFLAYVASVVYAVAITGQVKPIYSAPEAAGQAGFYLIATGIIVLAVTGYFVRQRDRFQQRSDDLLHNILPDEIAARLKDSRSMIAEGFESASVLFADVVDFTPMSAGMAPQELVTLLDAVFTTFDGFVEDLGLEKIKTIGDAYMAASGVPVRRVDHAEAIAELALRMRDHTASSEFAGRQIQLRIGINSGPVVAGIIGSRKFAYDLWGDTVNTASRMESSGIPGQIQVSASTCELIRDRFACQPRGVISVKGKGEMETYLLVSRAVGA